jgi:hypothetical protein
MHLSGGSRIMNREIESTLHTLLDKYDNKQSHAREVEERLRAEQDAFVADFERLADDVMRPAMDAIGILLRERGHDFDISARTERIDRQGRPLDARITMSVFPSGVARERYTPLNTPQVSFVCDRRARKVRVHDVTFMPTGTGRAASRGEWTIDRITPAFAERAIVDFLKEIL